MNGSSQFLFTFDSAAFHDHSIVNCVMMEFKEEIKSRLQFNTEIYSCLQFSENMITDVYLRIKLFVVVAHLSYNLYNYKLILKGFRVRLLFFQSFKWFLSTATSYIEREQVFIVCDLWTMVQFFFFCYSWLHCSAKWHALFWFCCFMFHCGLDKKVIKPVMFVSIFY